MNSAGTYTAGDVFMCANDALLWPAASSPPAMPPSHPVILIGAGDVINDPAIGLVWVVPCTRHSRVDDEYLEVHVGDAPGLEAGTYALPYLVQPVRPSRLGTWRCSLQPELLDEVKGSVLWILRTP